MVNPKPKLPNPKSKFRTKRSKTASALAKIHIQNPNPNPPRAPPHNESLLNGPKSKTEASILGVELVCCLNARTDAAVDHGSLCSARIVAASLGPRPFSLEIVDMCDKHVWQYAWQLKRLEWQRLFFNGGKSVKLNLNDTAIAGARWNQGARTSCDLTVFHATSMCSILEGHISAFEVMKLSSQKCTQRIDQFWEGMFCPWGSEFLDLEPTWDHSSESCWRFLPVCSFPSDIKAQ